MVLWCFARCARFLSARKHLHARDSSVACNNSLTSEYIEILQILRNGALLSAAQFITDSELSCFLAAGGEAERGVDVAAARGQVALGSSHDLHALRHLEDVFEIEFVLVNLGSQLGETGAQAISINSGYGRVRGRAEALLDQILLFLLVDERLIEGRARLEQAILLELAAHATNDVRNVVPAAEEGGRCEHGGDLVARTLR